MAANGLPLEYTLPLSIAVPLTAPLCVGACGDALGSGERVEEPEGVTDPVAEGEDGGEAVPRMLRLRTGETEGEASALALRVLRAEADVKTVPVDSGALAVAQLVPLAVGDMLPRSEVDGSGEALALGGEVDVAAALAEEVPLGEAVS